MKSRIVTFLILIAVVSVSVFGLTMINHTMEHSNNSCAVSVMTGMKCPEETLSMVQHHIASVKEFSTTLIPQIMTILALLAIAAASFKLIRYLIQVQTVRPQRFYLEKDTKNVYLEELHHWLSRFELSPSFTITAR